MSHAGISAVFLGCYAAGNECGGRYLEMSRTIADPGETIKTERRMMIDTVAWVHLENGRILCARPRGKGVFYVPGGKREGAESDLQTLLREVAEELTVALRPETVRHAGTYRADHPDGTAVRMSCYTGEYSGTLAASSEIDELAWFGYADRTRVPPVDQLLFDDLNAAGQLR
jgi:8-oxo-dGTP pyrophosphatase MutT (NUDIX family)